MEWERVRGFAFVSALAELEFLGNQNLKWSKSSSLKKSKVDYRGCPSISAVVSKSL